MTGTAPFWQVIGVFDPDQHTPDFSYTVGLASRGLPELHLWARPSHGSDPGVDWSFSHRDRGMLLNELASSLLSGTIAVGETFLREYDGGGTIVTFTLETPVPRDALDAYQAAPDALIIPVRWELERTPEGQRTPVAEDAVPELERVWAHLSGELDNIDTTRLPARWQPPTELDLDPTQPYGPLTSIVRAQASVIAGAGLGVLEDFLHVAMAAEQSIGASHVIALALTAARPVGRTAALDQLMNDTTTLVNDVLDDARLSELITAVDPDADPDDRDQLGHALRMLLLHALAALQLTHAVRDVADAPLRLAGLGPWAWAATDLAPSPDWLAPQEHLEAVRDLVGALGRDGLARLVTAHHDALADEDGPYDRLVHWLRAWQLTSACAIPDLETLLEGTASGAALNELWSRPEQVDLANDAVSVLTAARVHADGVGLQGRATLDAALGAALPGVGRWLAETDASAQPR